VGVGGGIHRWIRVYASCVLVVQGGGSYYHYVHHAYYDYNYGTPMVPLDVWFGSYNDGSKWRTKHGKSEAAAAAEANAPK
jgi:sterol desaturase/sphingolipid hydroxylase (fatty acid hydroxylase superfamily)